MADAPQTPSIPAITPPSGQGPADVGADEQLAPTPDPSPGAALAQPGYDINQALSDQLSSLRSDLPAYEPPDTSAQDKQIAKYRMSAEEADKRAQAITLQRSKYEEQMANELHSQDQQFSELFQQYPSRQVYYGTGLQAAPLLSMLTVLGGKAAGLSGRAMLGSLNGMMSGINDGSEENFQQHLAQWKTELEAYKQRHEMQMEIYQTMLGAYKDRVDAAQKARDFALDMTKDSMDQREKTIKDSIDIFKARAETISQIDRITALFGTHARQTAYDNLPAGALIYWERDQAAGMPAAKLTGAKRYQYYGDMLRQHPDPDKFDNVQWQRDKTLPPREREIATWLAEAQISLPGMYSMNTREPVLRGMAERYPTETKEQFLAAIRGERAATQQSQVASRILTTQETRTVTSAADLFSGPNSFANRLEAAAKKVDFGSATFASKMRLWAQGNVWSGDDMAVYLSQLTDFRSKMTTLLQNGGMSTEGAQHRAQELLPSPTSLSALRKILENSRAVAIQLEGKNAEILQGLRSGMPIDKIINLAKVPMQPQTAPRPQSPGQPAPAAPGTPGAAGPPGQQPKKGPRTIQAGAVSVIDGVKYRKGDDGKWYTVQ